MEWVSDSVSYLDLRAAVFSITPRFPPPELERVQEVCRLFSEAAREGTDAQVLAAAVREDATVHGHRFVERVEAVTTLGEVLAGAKTASPRRAFEQLYEKWPACWSAFVLLGRSFRANPTDRLACLSAADRTAPVGAPALIAELETYLDRDTPDARPNHWQRLRARELLARHDPTFDRLRAWIRKAINVVPEAELGDVIRRAISHVRTVHGPNPVNWITHAPDQCFGAARLCLQLNWIFLVEHDVTAYRTHAHAAVIFLRRALEGHDRREDRRLVLWSYLGEAISQLVRFPDDRTADAQLSALLDEAEHAVKASAGASPEFVTRALRVRAFAAAARLRNRRQSADSAMPTDTELAAARQSFEESLDSVANEWGLRVTGAVEYGEFLAEMGRDREAVAVELRYARRRFPEEIARSLENGGRANETLQALLGMLDAGDPSELSDLRLLAAVALVLQDARTSAARLKPGLHARALQYLQKNAASMTAECRSALDNLRVHRAARFAQALRIAEPDNERVTHLWSSVLLAQGRLAELAALFGSIDILAADAFMRGRFLTTLRHHPTKFHVSPDLPWRVATRRDPASGSFDAFMMSDALTWQTQEDDFAQLDERIVFAARSFPNDSFIASLPAQFRFRRGAVADPVLRRIWVRALGQPELWPWLNRAFYQVAGAFFIASEADFFQLWQAAQGTEVTDRRARRDLHATLTNGAVRGIIENWGHEADCRADARRVAEWFARLRVDRTDLWPWAAWFGAARNAFHEEVAAVMTRRLDALQQDLEHNSAATNAWWHERIERHLEESRRSDGRDVPDPRRSPESAAADLIERASAYVRTYSPVRLNKEYYRDLLRAVRRWTSSIPDAYLPPLAADLWMDLHKALEQDATRSIAEVAWHQLHAFKNTFEYSICELEPAAPISPPWRQRFLDIIERTRNFLDHYRQPLRLQPTDLREVIEEAAFMLAPPSASAGKQGAAIYREVPSTPVSVHGDRSQLLAVMHSLIQNAQAVTLPAHRGGWILAAVKREEDLAILTVEDNGGGIAAVDLAVLNDPDRHTSGFGMALCHRVTTLHGGTFSLARTALGLRAQVTLPLLRNFTT